MADAPTQQVARSPQDTSRLFEEHTNAHDLDALMTLFEPDAASAESATASIRGQAAIREALAGLLGMSKHMTLRPTQVITNEDLAMVVGDWEMQGDGPDGQPMSMTGRYVDVVRRQADGRWLFCIDNAWVGQPPG